MESLKDVLWWLRLYNTVLISSHGTRVGERHSPLGWACALQGMLYRQNDVSLSFTSEPNLKFRKVIVSLWDDLQMKTDLTNWANWRSPFQDASLNFFSIFFKPLSFDFLWGRCSGRWVTLVCFWTNDPASVTSLPFLIQLPTPSPSLFSDSFAIHIGRA